MAEELAIHEEVCTTLELFNITTKCARAKEGRLSLLELPVVYPGEKKAKVKDVKHKGVVRESWIRGSPDSRTISFGRTVGL